MTDAWYQHGCPACVICLNPADIWFPESYAPGGKLWMCNACHARNWPHPSESIGLDTAGWPLRPS